MTNRKKHIKKLIYGMLIIGIMGTLILLFNKSIQIWIDQTGINDLKEEVHNNFNAGNADSLRRFLDTFDLAVNTRTIFTNKIKTRKRSNWSLNKKFNNQLIEEIAVFPSLLSNFNSRDSAYFYIYRKNGYTNSKIILWIPGLGVSDFAFNFIQRFFIHEIENGYTVIVYIPPFHMNRSIPGKENGEGFIGSNILNNIIIQLEATREIRTMLDFLQQQNPKEISAWGGSMGASFLLMSTQFYTFNHISLMIPVIDWGHIMLQNQDLKSLMHLYANAGIDSAFFSTAFKVISPVNYRLNIPPEKTLIQIADYDQLTPKSKILEFADKYKIKALKSYKRGHSTMLVCRELYSDYETFLDSL